MTKPVQRDPLAQSDDVCVCGEVLDEHDPETGACTRDGCPCITFEQEGD